MFAAIRRWIEARRTALPEAENPHGYGGMPVAGVRVTPETAMKSAAVWACHRYLTQTVAQLPVRVLRETGTSSRRVPGHPVASIFTWRANAELSPFQLKETLTGWAVMYGNGIAEIERDMAGRVVALWPIEPERVMFERDAQTDELLYRIDNGMGRGSVVLRGMDVFHLRGFGDGPVGESVIEYAAESLGWARATELFGAAFYGNGLNPGIVIKGAGNLDQAGQDRLRAALKARHGGPRKASTPLFLDKGMEATQLSVKPNDAQFIETAQYQVEEICRWFGVPPHKIAHLLRSTFSNIEHQAIEVVVDTITPWVMRWEEEANYKLFGQNRAGLFVKFDLKGLMRGDFKSRQEGLQLQRRNGIISADEWRELEDMGPMVGTGGDKFIVEGNMTTLAKVGEDVAPAPAAAPASAAPSAALMALVDQAEGVTYAA